MSLSGRLGCCRLLAGVLSQGGAWSVTAGTALGATAVAPSSSRGAVRHLADWVSFLQGGNSSQGSVTDARSSGGQGAGLFGRPELQQPADWNRVAAATEVRCDELLAEILTCTPSDGVRVVELMDDMSDELCRAYDAAECCRNVHVDPEWRQAAERVCVKLGVADFWSRLMQFAQLGVPQKGWDGVDATHPILAVVNGEMLCAMPQAMELEA